MSSDLWSWKGVRISRYCVLVFFITLLIPLTSKTQTAKIGTPLSLPDIVIKEAKLSPSPAKSGQEVTIRLYVANLGQTPIQQGLNVRGEARPGKWSAVSTFDSLSPGQAVRVVFRYRIPRDAKEKISFAFSVSSSEEPAQNRGNNQLQACLRILPASMKALDVVGKRVPDWIIKGIFPSEKTTTKGKAVAFDILLTNLTRSKGKQVDVSVIPTIPGQKEWFEVKPFLIRNVYHKQSFRAKIQIKPTYRTTLGLHRFYTCVKVPGCPPFVIKEGPGLRIIQASEELTLSTAVLKEVLITVKTKKGALESLLERLKRSYRVKVKEVTELGFLGRFLILLRIPDERTVQGVIEALSSDPYKLMPQPNYIYQSFGAKGDPFSDLQYALKALRIDRLPPGIDGRGVKIGLIDTGVDFLHQDLMGKVVEKKAIIGNGSFRNDLHGTALAGIISARCGNGMGICGVAPGVDIVAIKACRPIVEGKIAAMTTSFWLAQGLDYSILQKVKVVNLSLGGPRDPLITELIKGAFSRGIVLVAAAGDKGLPNYPTFPAALPEVIAVTAVDLNKEPYSEGIKGEFIDLCAPGVDIITTTPGNKYNFYTGTSMAAAFVSGSVALLLQVHSDLQPSEVYKVLEVTAMDLGSPGKDTQFGWGVINVSEAIKSFEPFSQ